MVLFVSSIILTVVVFWLDLVFSRFGLIGFLPAVMLGLLWAYEVEKRDMPVYPFIFLAISLVLLDIANGVFVGLSLGSILMIFLIMKVLLKFTWLESQIARFSLLTTLVFFVKLVVNYFNYGGNLVQTGVLNDVMLSTLFIIITFVGVNWLVKRYA